MRYFLTLLLLMLAGCDNKSLGILPTSEKVELIRLKDGTRCAVYHGYIEGSISCDWRNK